MDSQDQEITLGTGRLLGLFFGLVVVCALFFSLGFSLGRKTILTAEAATAPPAPAAISNEPKSAPGKIADSKDCAAGQPCPHPASTTDELTFYKAVAQNEAKAKLETPPPPTPAPAPSAAAPAPAVAEASKPPELPKASPIGAGYMVQVAAVTKQEDAEVLVGALRKKDYPVFAATQPSDKLYHVQVGPFADAKDAEAVRAKLIGDGYNPILKK